MPKYLFRPVPGGGGGSRGPVEGSTLGTDLPIITRNITINYSYVSDIVVFDNSFSWTRAKKLKYLVELHTSDMTTETEVDHVSGGSWTRLANDLQITRL